MFENYWGNGFFVLGGWVVSPVPSCLSFDVGVGPASCVDDGAAPTTCHKGRCHMVNGRSRSISLDLLLGSGSPKITTSHCVHESTADPYSASLIELLQVGVSMESDSCEETHPDIPAAIVLLMSAFGNSLVPGHLCASDATQEICLWGRLMSLN